MGRFQLELIYLYFPPTLENKGKLILIEKLNLIKGLVLADYILKTPTRMLKGDSKCFNF